MFDLKKMFFMDLKIFMNLISTPGFLKMSANLEIVSEFKKIFTNSRKWPRYLNFFREFLKYFENWKVYLNLKNDHEFKKGKKEKEEGKIHRIFFERKKINKVEKTQKMGIRMKLKIRENSKNNSP